MDITTLRAALAERADMQRRHAALGVPASIGDIGEAIVALEHPDWQRMPRNTEAYDFVDEAGRRVQVKCWASHHRTHDVVKSEAERLIRIRLNADGTWKTINDVLLSGHFVDGAARVAIGKHGRPVTHREGTAPAYQAALI